MTGTTEHFADRLSRLIDERGPICAGLDPRQNQLPEITSDVAWARMTVRVLRDRVPVFKPQIAFWGDSWERLFEIQAFEGGYGDAICIADCKRGDIGSTAKAYAEEIFERTWVDAITINPYLGKDSLEPFVEAAEKHNRGLFVLVQTSNPGADDLQTVESLGMTIAERVAKIVRDLGHKLSPSKTGRTRVGAVIGLTVSPAEIKSLRASMPNSFFLMPGYGAQGGNPESFAAALDARGGGVIVNASRSLTLPWGSNIPAPNDAPSQIIAAHDAMKADLEGQLA